MPKQLPSSAVVVEGDIERRIISVYTPDFYKDDPVFGPSLDLLKNSIPLMDYLFEKANALPQLVDIDMCPLDLLSHLGALLGYTFKGNVDGEKQRKEIAKLVSVYHIRGTSLSVVRVVLNAGAKYGEVFTPYEHLFRLSVSKLSGGDRFEAGTFWRWGTYEVITDVDFALAYDDIQDIHPAGTKWYGRQLVYLEDEDPPTQQEESPTDTYIYHVDESVYCSLAADQYDEGVLADKPNGYWKLDEPATLLPITDDDQATYGSAVYGVSTYSGTFAGLPAYDSSGNSLTGTYNNEVEQVGIADGVSTTIPDTQLSVTPVVPGTVKLLVAGKLLTDNGAGKFTGDGAGVIDYDTGDLTSIQFFAPPGQGPLTLPLLLASDTLPAVTQPPNSYWDADTVTGVTGDKISSWSDSSTNGRTATNVNYAGQPTLEAGTNNGHNAVKFDGSQSLSFTADALGNTHTIFFAARFDDTTGIQYLLTNAGNASALWYDGSDSTFHYSAESPNTTATVWTYPVVAGTWYQFKVRRSNATQVILAINGYQFTSATISAATVFSPTILGQGFKGAIGGLVTYPYSSGLEQSLVERYFGKKYNISTTLLFEADPDTIAAADGASINAEWQPKQITNRSLSQSTSGKRPTYRAAFKNGHAAVEFDGSGTQDVLALDTGLGLSTFHTIFVVFQIDTMGSPGTVHKILGGTNLYLSYTDNGLSSKLTYSSGVSVDAPQVLTAGRVYTLAVVRSNTSINFYLDSVAASSTLTLGANNAATLSYIGADTSAPTTDNLYGKLLYTSVYKVALSYEEVLNISSYLQTRYATVNKPVLALYNDYVLRGIDGAISHIDRTSARFGFRESLNKGFVKLPASDLLKPRKMAYTVECWLRVPNGEGGTYYGNRWVQSSQNFVFDARVNRTNGLPEIYIGAPIGSNEYFITGPDPIWDGKWHHVVVALEPDSTFLKLYVDGVQVAATEYKTVADLNATGNFLIGALSETAPQEYFRGDIDEVAVYRPTYGMLVQDSLTAGDSTKRSQPSALSAWVGELVTVGDAALPSRRVFTVSDGSPVSDRVVVRILTPRFTTVIDTLKVRDDGPTVA